MKKITALTLLISYTAPTFCGYSYSKEEPPTPEIQKEIHAGPGAFGNTPNASVAIQDGKATVITGNITQGKAEIITWDLENPKKPAHSYTTQVPKDSDIFNTIFTGNNKNVASFEYLGEWGYTKKIVFGTLESTEIKNIKETDSYQNQTNPFITNGGFNPSGDRFAILSDSGIKIFDPNSTKQTLFLPETYSELTWNDDDTLIANHNQDNVVNIWNIKQEKKETQFNTGIWRASKPTATKDIIAFQGTSEDGALYKTLIYSLAGKQLLNQDQSNTLVWQKLNPSGDKLAILPFSKKDHKLIILDTQTGKALGVIDINDPTEWTQDQTVGNPIYGTGTWSTDSNQIAVVFNDCYGQINDLRAKNQSTSLKMNENN